MKTIQLLITIAFFHLVAEQTSAEVTSDSISSKNEFTYYTDYSHLLHLKPYMLFKLNTVEIIQGNERLSLSPNSPTALGFGLNYKFAGIAIGFGLPHTQESIRKYGNTSRLDLQLSLFTRNLGFDGHLQLYKGYYNENPNDFMEWNEPYYPHLPDIRTVSIGSSIYYVVNNKKYSNKASIMRTQKQNKSAGSLLTGVFFSFDEAQAPNGFIPIELPDSISYDFDLTGYRYVATGVNLGYAYTLVLSERLFINASTISGGGYKYIRVNNANGVSDAEQQVHAQLLLRGVIGYEHKSFSAGISASTLIRTINYKSYEIDIATEQLRFYAVWRIKTK